MFFLFPKWYSSSLILYLHFVCFLAYSSPLVLFFLLMQAVFRRWDEKKCSWFYNKSQNAFIFHEKIYIIISRWSDSTGMFWIHFITVGWTPVYVNYFAFKVKHHLSKCLHCFIFLSKLFFCPCFQKYFKNIIHLLVGYILVLRIFAWVRCKNNNLSPSLRVVFCCEVTQFV